MLFLEKYSCTQAVGHVVYPRKRATFLTGVIYLPDSISVSSLPDTGAKDPKPSGSQQLELTDSKLVKRWHLSNGQAQSDFSLNSNVANLCIGFQGWWCRPTLSPGFYSYACNPNTQEVEAGGPGVQDHPWQHKGFETTLCNLRPLKQETHNQSQCQDCRYTTLLLFTWVLALYEFISPAP